MNNHALENRVYSLVRINGGLWAVDQEGDWNGPLTLCRLFSVEEATYGQTLDAWVDAYEIAFPREGLFRKFAACEVAA